MFVKLSVLSMDLLKCALSSQSAKKEVLKSIVHCKAECFYEI